jgi:DNA-binding IscR family transcriptional regulator
VRVLDVVTALGGRLFDASFCDRHSGLESSCLNTSDCSIRPVLHHLQAAVDHVLGELTLQSLLASEREVAGTIHPKEVPIPLHHRLS